jgi:hypothetical protein
MLAPMRAMWSGAVSFGLVSVPVKLYSATTNHDVRFHQVHATDGGRIKYRRVCTVDGEEVEYADIVKGYETARRADHPHRRDLIPCPWPRPRDRRDRVQPSDQIDLMCCSRRATT